MARIDAAGQGRFGRLGESRPNERLKGIVFVAAAALIFTLQDVIIKLVSGRYPLAEAITIRCVVAFLPILILIHFDGGLSLLRARWSPLVVLRGLMMLGSYTCYRPGQWSYWQLEGEREGNVHFCGEHTSPDFQGWMEGAAETGAFVAAEVLNDLELPYPEPLAAILDLKPPQPTWGLGEPEERRAPLARRRAATRR